MNQKKPISPLLFEQGQNKSKRDLPFVLIKY